MGRLKALYRSQAIACAGTEGFRSRHRKSGWRSWPTAGCSVVRDDCIRNWMLLQQLRREAQRDLIRGVPQV